MKTCDYCGKQVENIVVFCSGCGTEFQAQEIAQFARSPNATWSLKAWPRTLDARTATIILLAHLGIEFFSGFALVVFALLRAHTQGVFHAERITNALDKVMPAAILVGALLGGIGTIVMSFVFIPAFLKDTSPTGAAWVPGRWREIATGFFTGLMIAVGIPLIKWAIGYHHYIAYKDMGPVAQMAVTPGFPQMAWLIFGVLLAPPSEELLFRGVLYGGYRKTYGPIWAALITTFIFVLLHVPEAIHSKTAIFSITVVALAALRCRLRSGAIGPAMALHFGYNAVISFKVLYRIWH